MFVFQWQAVDVVTKLDDEISEIVMPVRTAGSLGATKSSNVDSKIYYVINRLYSGTINLHQGILLSMCRCITKIVFG